MSVNQFMLENVSAIREIIYKLPRPFDSHKFIQVFTQQFQSEYSEMLSEYSDSKQPFKIVHQQIGRFLSKHKTDLGITGFERKNSSNIFGKSNANEMWQ
jgi:hypothetical protein